MHQYSCHPHERSKQKEGEVSGPSFLETQIQDCERTEEDRHRHENRKAHSESIVVQLERAGTITKNDGMNSDPVRTPNPDHPDS